MSGDDDPAANVRQRLTEYLAARREWEVSAWQRSGLADRDPDAVSPLTPEGFIDELKVSYRELNRRFVHPSKLEPVQPVFGDPPSVDPATTEVVRVDVRGTRAVVETREPLHPTSAERDSVEYEWRLEDGIWWLIDRRTRDWNGRWIHRIF